MTARLKPLCIVVACVLPFLGCNRSAPEDSSAAPQVAPTAAEVASGHTDSKAVDSPKGERVPRIFVSNYQGDTISVIEGDPGMEVKSIPLEGSPHGMAIRPTEPRLLAVARSTDFGVRFYDPDTLENKGDVETSRGPQDLKFSPDGSLLYVISPLSLELHVIDVATMKTVGKPLTFEKKPRRILVDPAGQSLFVLLVAPTEDSASEVAVVDMVKRTIERRIPVGAQPQALALGNNGRSLVSASFDESTLTVIDTKSLEVVATYEALTGMGLSIHPTKPIAYSSESFDDTIQVLDLDTGKEITTLSPGQWPTYSVISPDGRYLYVPHEESDSLVKIDTDTNQVVAKIAVGKAPIEVVIYQP